MLVICLICTLLFIQIIIKLDNIVPKVNFPAKWSFLFKLSQDSSLVCSHFKLVLLILLHLLFLLQVHFYLFPWMLRDKERNDLQIIIFLIWLTIILHTFDVFRRNNLTIAVRMVYLGINFRTWLWRYLFYHVISSSIRIRRFLILAAFIETCVWHKLWVVAKLFFVNIIAASTAICVRLRWFWMIILRIVAIGEPWFLLFF